jgi:hypothetical protein
MQSFLNVKAGYVFSNLFALKKERHKNDSRSVGIGGEFKTMKDSVR